MSVVTLPAPFAFRANEDDPHPMPWVRVKLSCALGEALFPDPQWQRISALWSGFYPTERLSAARRAQIEGLVATMPTLVSLLLGHRPRSLRGATLAEALPVRSRSPSRLRALVRVIVREPSVLHRMRPALVFAAVGQGRADGALDSQEENRILSGMLSAWALRNATTSAGSRARWKPLRQADLSRERLSISTEEKHG